MYYRPEDLPMGPELEMEGSAISDLDTDVCLCLSFKKFKKLKKLEKTYKMKI
jgi:hypothetical protein